MKSFHLTVWGILLLFFAVMACVATVAFIRGPNSCKLDPAHIRDMREMASSESER